LFNRIVGEQRAVVHNLPGVTRDRLYASAQWRVGDRLIHFTIVDTGGLEPGAGESLNDYVARQTQIAIEESDIIIAVVDGRAGLLPADEELIRTLRKADKKLFLAINKIDVDIHDDLIGPFHKLGLQPAFPVSAQTNRGIDALMHHVLLPYGELERELRHDSDQDVTRVAIIGRPNVGKSKLLNALCGKERCVVSDEPGTTIDSIDTYIHYDDRDYLLIDTAGIRRQAKIDATLEYLAVLRSMRAVGRAHIALLVIDATEGITHQELRLAEQIFLRGRGMVVFFNKCDLVEGELPKTMPHFPHVPTCGGAAKNGVGLDKLIRLVQKVMRSYTRSVSTSTLNRIVEKITMRGPTPSPGGHPLKVRYITQVGQAPPVLQIFVNRLERLTANYEKYLRNSFYEELKLSGVPLKLEFKE
jgi:GTP-binding protein